MMKDDDDTTIGAGGWGLVVLSGVVAYFVLHSLLHYHPVPAGLFSAALALIVLLVLYRLADAVNRYEDDEEARRVRKVVPSSADMGMRIGDGPGAPAAMAVPKRADGVIVPQRPSSVVRPLSEVEAAPVILPQTLASAPVDSVKPVIDAPKSAAAKSKPKAAPKTTKEKAEPKPKAEKAAKPKVAKTAAPKGLVRLKAARRGKPDNLQEIEGIGPALEKLVNSLGFYHFDQIAAWTEGDVATVDAEMKTFKGRITRDKWVEQATIIVKDGLEAFRERARTNDY